MKVIFLDIDGVLNSDLYIRRHSRPGVVIDESRLALIRRIVEKTDARIVLSSSWKEHWSRDEAGCDETGREMNAIFARCGLRIFDKTPEISRDRKAEITAWLDAHPEVGKFVVVDDRPFEEDRLRGHFVLTSGVRLGIDEDDARRAIIILNGESRPADDADTALRFSIMGDSISTFEGFQPLGYDVFYTEKRAAQAGLDSVGDTWWMQVIRRLGGKLCANDSYSGSFVAGETSAAAHSRERIENLVAEDGSEPDVVLIAMGANDCGAGVPLCGENETDELALAPSYRMMLSRIRERLPKAKIFCTTIMLTDEETAPPRVRRREYVETYNNVIREVARMSGCALLETFDERIGYTTVDGMHPDKAGHRLIADTVLEKLNAFL